MTRALAPEIELQLAVNAWLLAGDSDAAYALANLLAPALTAKLSGAHAVLAEAATACLAARSPATRRSLEVALHASTAASADQAAADRDAAAHQPDLPAYPWQRRADLA